MNSVLTQFEQEEHEMTDREVLRLALATLDEVRSETFRLLRNGQRLYAEEKVWNTVIAIKERLAQPEQEPVIDKSASIRIATALGWTPPRTWVDLTAEEVLQCWEKAHEPGNKEHINAIRMADEVEQALKEKNT